MTEHRVRISLIRPHLRRARRYYVDVLLDSRPLCGLLIIVRARGDVSVIPPPAPRRSGVTVLAYELTGAERVAIATAVTDFLQYRHGGDAA